MITENLLTLKIHKLSQKQYDRELEAGRIDSSALYLTPDEIIIDKREITQSDYNALSDKEKNNGTMYLITDASDIGTAGQISYNNISSGLNAIDVQAAIDELNTTHDLSDNVILDSKDSRIESVEFHAKRYGNIIALCVRLVNCNFTTENWVATNNLDMKISGIPLPSYHVTSCTYIDGEIFATRLHRDGIIRIRNNNTEKSKLYTEMIFNFEYIV